MSEMVERVAKALCKAADDDWDLSVFYIVDARDTAETGRDIYREMARAAIEAMRQPTPKMTQVVSANWGRRTWSEYGEVIDAALQD